MSKTPQNPPPRTCATCAHFTPHQPTLGLCQPPEALGGEPFAISVRPGFLACWMYRRKTSSENNRKQ